MTAMRTKILSVTPLNPLGVTVPLIQGDRDGAQRRTSHSDFQKIIIIPSHILEKLFIIWYSI